MTRIVFPRKPRRTLLIQAMLGIAVGCMTVQAEEAVPKELAQYIRAAQRRGWSEAKIRQDAALRGWPAANIDAGLARGVGADAASAASHPAAAAESRAAEPPPANIDPGRPELRDDYRIGAGDTLQISVWKEPEASVPTIVVRSDGRITMPLIKEVQVAGMTPREAEKVITAGLARFFNDPNVTVIVTTATSKKVYVVGAVKKEGPVPYIYGMTVVQALSEVGGLTEYAKRKKIYILRTEAGRDYRLDFNYEEVIRGERMEQNIVLLPGDTLVVPH